MNQNSNPTKLDNVQSQNTFPITFSVPAEIANQGVYAAIFGDSGIGGPQVFLTSQLGADGNYMVASASLAASLVLPATTITINSAANFPAAGGNLLITETDQYNNITAQTTVSYTSYASQTFSGVTGGTGTFNPGSTVTLALDWTLSNTLAANAPVPLLELFPSQGSYTGTVTAVINLPSPGLTGNSIYSGELVMFVGQNSGIQANASQELVVPTLGSNPNDTFALFEWGLAGALTSDSGGFIDYDVSAIDQVGFPFQVTALVSSAQGAPTAPPAPFDQGVGFRQCRGTLFSGFTPFLLGLPTPSNAGAFISLAPENSLAATRITAPQDLLNFVVNNGPGFPQVAPGITGFQPIQNPTGTGSFTFSVDPNSAVVQTEGCGYQTEPTLTFSAPPQGTTAIGTASLGYVSVNVSITNAGSGYVEAPTVTFSPPSSGTTATGTANLNSGSVTGVRIINPGSGYTEAPSVTFSASPNGVTATGTANLCRGITGISITNTGSGYTSAPAITVSNPPEGGLLAAVAIGLAGDTFNYAITALRVNVAVTDGGNGYTSAPTVSFSAPASGTTITGTAVLGTGITAGQVVGIYITNPGSGYTSVPTVTFSGGGGTGAAATADFIESMAGIPQQAQINQGTVAVLNWNPYPYATAYNIYRSTGADMSNATCLNGSVPYTPASLPAATTLNQSANSSSTTLTVSCSLPANMPSVGTLLISQGNNESLFQYSSIATSTFTGKMFGTAGFTSGASVTLLPNYLDNGITGVSATPPVNNYNYEPLNQYFTTAIKDFFDYYRPTKHGGSGNSFVIDLAGSVSTKWTGQTNDVVIDGNTYTLLQLTGEQGHYGNGYAGKTANIYQPFFTTNVDSDAFNPEITLPPPPDWLISPSESPAAMVFGADGVFDTPDSLSTAPAAIIQDIMNPINIAINRGLTPRHIDGTWVNVLSPDYWAQANLVPLTALTAETGGSLPQRTYYYAVTGVNVNGDTSGQETIPGNIVTVQAGELSSADQNTVTLTIPNTGATTFSSFNIYRGVSPESLMKIGFVTPEQTSATTFTDNGLPNGTVSPPFVMNAPGQAVNWYAAYLHQLDVSINGLSYGTPYDDQGGFSSNVQLSYAGTTPQPPQGLIITLQPWNSVFVQANQAWQTTGVTVTSSAITTITYQSGKWTADPRFNNGQLYTAAGNSEITVNQSEYPLMGVPMGALVGRVGNHVFLVGVGPTTVPGNLSGELELCINDDLTAAYGAGLTDNIGSVTVQITVS